MTDLFAVTALGHETPRRETFGELALAEIVDRDIVSLALRRGQTIPLLAGSPLPGPGGLAESGGVIAFWTGPDQWFLAGPRHRDCPLEDVARECVPGASMTMQSDGWAWFEFEGGDAAIAALLEKLVDADPASLAPGSALRSTVHHIGAFLLRPARERLAVLGPRSMAADLWHTLVATARRLA